MNNLGGERVYVGGDIIGDVGVEGLGKWEWLLWCIWRDMFLNGRCF